MRGVCVCVVEVTQNLVLDIGTMEEQYGSIWKWQNLLFACSVTEHRISMITSRSQRWLTGVDDPVTSTEGGSTGN